MIENLPRIESLHLSKEKNPVHIGCDNTGLFVKKKEIIKKEKKSSMTPWTSQRYAPLFAFAFLSLNI